MDNYQPKITEVEILIITPILVIFDAIGIVLLIFGLDDFFILDAFRFPFTQIYLYMKGVKGTATLVGNILESIPYVGALPISTVSWVITIWMDRNPKSIITQTTQKVTSFIPGQQGKLMPQKFDAATPSLRTTMAAAQNTFTPEIPIAKPLTGVKPTA